VIGGPGLPPEGYAEAPAGALFLRSSGCTSSSSMTGFIEVIHG
jgi:hypothetical protein